MLIILIVPKKNGTSPQCRTTWRSTRIGQEIKRTRENVSRRLYCGFHRKASETQSAAEQA